MSRLSLLHLGLAALDPIDNRPPFSVGDVKRGRDPAPTGKVKIHARRGSVIHVTEPIDAATIDWSKLLDDDRIEVLK